MGPGLLRGMASEGGVQYRCDPDPRTVAAHPVALSGAEAGCEPAATCGICAVVAGTLRGGRCCRLHGTCGSPYAVDHVVCDDAGLAVGDREVWRRGAVAGAVGDSARHF